MLIKQWCEKTNKVCLYSNENNICSTTDIVNSSTCNFALNDYKIIIKKLTKKQLYECWIFIKNKPTRIVPLNSILSQLYDIELQKHSLTTNTSFVYTFIDNAIISEISNRFFKEFGGFNI